MPTICSSNSVAYIIIYCITQSWGTNWLFNWLEQSQATEIWSGPEVNHQKCGSHWFCSVSPKTLHLPKVLLLLFMLMISCHLSILTKLNNCRKFEKEFNAELQSLGSILSSSSQAEPYLAHLAQWILGVKNEQNGLWCLLNGIVVKC